MGDPPIINQIHLVLLSFGKTGDTEGVGIIVKDNLAGHFCIKALESNELMNNL